MAPGMEATASGQLGFRPHPVGLLLTLWTDEPKGLPNQCAERMGE